MQTAIIPASAAPRPAQGTPPPGAAPARSEVFALEEPRATTRTGPQPTAPGVKVALGRSAPPEVVTSAEDTAAPGEGGAEDPVAADGTPDREAADDRGGRGPTLAAEAAPDPEAEAVPPGSVPGARADAAVAEPDGGSSRQEEGRPTVPSPDVARTPRSPGKDAPVDPSRPDVSRPASPGGEIAADVDAASRSAEGGRIDPAPSRHAAQRPSEAQDAPLPLDPARPDPARPDPARPDATRAGPQGEQTAPGTLGTPVPPNGATPAPRSAPGDRDAPALDSSAETKRVEGFAPRAAGPAAPPPIERPAPLVLPTAVAQREPGADDAPAEPSDLPQAGDRSQPSRGDGLRAAAPLGSQAPALTAHVARQLTDALPSRPGSVEIRLDPRELGSVRITLSSADGAMTALVVAERPETADLLRRHMGDLESALREAAGREVSVDVSGGGSMAERGRDPTPGTVATIGAEERPAAAIPSPRPAASGGRGLDLRL